MPFGVLVARGGNGVEVIAFVWVFVGSIFLVCVAVEGNRIGVEV